MTDKPRRLGVVPGGYSPTAFNCPRRSQTPVSAFRIS